MYARYIHGGQSDAADRGKQTSSDSYQGPGRVREVCDETQHLYLIECERRLIVCRCAFSCLLQPAADDQVWVSVTPGAAFILGILARPTPTTARLNIPVDMDLHAHGELRLHVAGALRLRSDQALELCSPQLDGKIDSGRLNARSLTLQSDELCSQIGLWRQLGRVVESVFERVVQVVKYSFRTVEEVDHLRTGNLDYSATQTARVHAKNTLLTADYLTKVDGEQIHLG